MKLYSTLPMRDFLVHYKNGIGKDNVAKWQREEVRVITNLKSINKSRALYVGL